MLCDTLRQWKHRENAPNFALVGDFKARSTLKRRWLAVSSLYGAHSESSCPLCGIARLSAYSSVFALIQFLARVYERVSRTC